MKFIVLSSLAGLAAVSAQNAVNNTVATTTVPILTTSTIAAAAVPTGNVCAVQSTFELCLQNEDNYIKTCQDQDFACLCRWNKEKLTCWNNCPNADGYGAQQALVQNYCSMPGANVSITPWTSSVAATSTPIVQSSAVSTSTTSANSTPTNKTSSASILMLSQGALAIVGVVATYMLF
ncbi:uncharacterized protein BX663DRAFT_506644 [Cokeromyces recurvatus]|uniref:uncharacterized protein n=1 Tax=Cokeromyces recurvatus TaxID=90255 RepID=UPI0022210166|nr:uncharacterized protein BX663DRAFT_506644 [Cokeromyces recurvatus]KAI7903489.1 hypothetical protein BX663DRAFT_506644 [Cokeromyces recurvatus]